MHFLKFHFSGFPVAFSVVVCLFLLSHMPCDNVSFINKTEYVVLLFSLHVYFDTNKFSMLNREREGGREGVKCSMRCFKRSHKTGGRTSCGRERNKQFIFWMRMLVVTAFSFLSSREPSWKNENKKFSLRRKWMKKWENSAG